MKLGRRGERGSILIWSTFAVVMLAVLLAVVVNVGHLTSVRGELQNAVDASALASARELSGRASELALADVLADEQAEAHLSDTFEVETSAVHFGAWVPPGRSCDPEDVQMTLDHRDGYSTDSHKFCRVTGTDARSAFRINAVYVKAQRNDAAPGGRSVPMLFGGLLSRVSAPVAASAVAVTGGPCGSGCLNVPMVVGVGCFTGGDGGMICDPAQGEDQEGPLYAYGLSDTAVRTVGWSVFSQTAPSQSAICDYLKTSKDTCNTIDVGMQVDLIDIGQGVKLNGECNPDKKTKLKTCDWFADHIGHEIEVPVISKSGGMGEACPDTYNGTAQIVGFATYRVLFTECKTGNGCTPRDSPWCGKCDTASDACIVTRLVCNHLNGENHSTGCAWTGTSPLRPVLVR